MTIFSVFFISVTVSIILIPILMRYAVELGMVDEPGERKVHQNAIPRCGGIGLAIGAVIAVLLFLPKDHALFSLVSGSAIILVFGFLDDRLELNYKWKFFGQFLATGFVIYGGIKIVFLPFLGFEPAPWFLTIPLTVIFTIGVTNAVNLSDGLDGLAAGIMLLTLLAIAFMAYESLDVGVIIFALAVVGGIVGFLWFNTHPAIVFMGDTGSQFIGFIVVFLTIYLTQDVNPAYNPALPLLLVGLPILDTLTVMIRRIRSGRSPFSPDKTHIHHRLLELGFTHAEAVGAIYLLHSIFLIAALYFRYSSDVVVVGVYLIISLGILALFYVAKKNNWSLHNTQEGADRRGRSIWRNEYIFQYSRIFISVSIGFYLLLTGGLLIDEILALPAGVFALSVLGMLLFFMAPRFIQNLWIRFSVYNAAILSLIMKDEFPQLSVLDNGLLDGFLFILIIVVSIAIRTTRKSKFILTTQDLLIILFTLFSSFIVGSQLIGSVLFRLFSLGYAIEYLIHRDFYKSQLLRFIAAFSGFIVFSLVWLHLH